MSHLCTDKDCYSYGKYCRLHRSSGVKKGEEPKPAVAKPSEEEKKETSTDRPKKKPRQKLVNQFSKKRAKEERLYKKEVKAELSEGVDCEIKSPVCTGRAQGKQHIVKRSLRNLRDKKNQLNACNACNGWCETHPKEAMLLGAVKSKFLEPARRA